MAYHILHRRWPKTRPIWFSMAFELLGLIPILVLFGIAQPDLYRTKLWQVGYDNKFNSNPLMILYAYANHRPLPTVPLVWSQLYAPPTLGSSSLSNSPANHAARLTNFNVAISVVTLFILLVKMVMYIMHVWYPLVGLLANISMVAIWTVSVYGQMGPDYADPRYQSSIAWYISKSCSYAEPYGLAKSCMLAKGTFAVSVYMLFLYLVNLGLAIWAMWPREGADYQEDDEEDEYNAGAARKEKELEMQNMRIPMTPGRNPPFTPYTPRTMAFQTLDRKLPLRHS
jgi:hypothetical protein